MNVYGIKRLKLRCHSFQHIILTSIKLKLEVKKLHIYQRAKFGTKEKRCKPSLKYLIPYRTLKNSKFKHKNQKIIIKNKIK